MWGRVSEVEVVAFDDGVLDVLIDELFVEGQSGS